MNQRISLTENERRRFQRGEPAGARVGAGGWRRPEVDAGQFPSTHD